MDAEDIHKISKVSASDLIMTVNQSRTLCPAIMHCVIMSILLARWLIAISGICSWPEKKFLFETLWRRQGQVLSFFPSLLFPSIHDVGTRFIQCLVPYELWKYRWRLAHFFILIYQITHLLWRESILCVIFFMVVSAYAPQFWTKAPYSSWGSTNTSPSSSRSYQRFIRVKKLRYSI